MSAGTFSRSVTFTDRVMWLDGAIVIALVLQTRGCWLMFSHWPFQCHFKAGKVTTGLTESNSNLLLSLLLLLHLGCVFLANKCIISLSSPKGPECTLSCYVPPPPRFIHFLGLALYKSLTYLLTEPRLGFPLLHYPYSAHASNMLVIITWTDRPTAPMLSAMCAPGIII